MIFIKKAQQGDQDTCDKPQEIHDIENTQFPFLVAAQRWLVTNVPDITAKTEETFCCLIHGSSLRFSFERAGTEGKNVLATK